jgi:acyl-CoA thioesterase FadM
MKYFAYSQKSFIYKYVVMLSDIDQFKHMSFANYLRLMYLASDALFVSGVKDFSEKLRLRALNMRMQFKRPTVVGDHLLIKVNASTSTPPKFCLLYTFMMEKTAELVGLGRQEYVCESLTAGCPNGNFESFCDHLRSIEMDEKFLLYRY